MPIRRRHQVVASASRGPAPRCQPCHGMRPATGPLRTTIAHALSAFRASDSSGDGRQNRVASRQGVGPWANTTTSSRELIPDFAAAARRGQSEANPIRTAVRLACCQRVLPVVGRGAPRPQPGTEAVVAAAPTPRWPADGKNMARSTLIPWMAFKALDPWRVPWQNSGGGVVDERKGGRGWVM